MSLMVFQNNANSNVANNVENNNQGIGQQYQQFNNQRTFKPEFFVKPDKLVCFLDSFFISLIPFTLLYVFFLLLKNILQIDLESEYLLIIQLVLALLVIIFMVLSYNRKSSYIIELYDNFIQVIYSNEVIERINYVFITGISYNDDYIDKIFKTNSIKLNDILAIRHVKNADKLIQFINYLYQYNMRMYKQ